MKPLHSDEINARDGRAAFGEARPVRPVARFTTTEG